MTPNPLPVVTGGTLTSDATYYYRTFDSSGTFSVNQASLNFDVVVVGGGGGATGARVSGSANQDGVEYDATGGGGSGGVSYLTSQTLLGNAIVTLGAGGSGGSPDGATVGSASVFGNTTSGGGGKSPFSFQSVQSAVGSGAGGGAFIIGTSPNGPN